MKTFNPPNRFGPALPVAATVTFGLFFVMQLLVAERDVIPLDERPAKEIRWEKATPPEPPTKTVREKPDEVIPPEPPVYKPDKTVSREGGILPVFPKPVTGPQDPTFGIGARSLTPLIQVTPIYPKRATMANVEGYVILEFTVLPDGTVTDIIVLDESPKGYGFAKSSMQAAAKFKYNPRIVNGQKVATTGVREKFNFELKD